MGVGGLFDFCSGRIPHAPLWLREIGLAGTSLAVDPGAKPDMAALYSRNPLFLYRVWKQARQEAKSRATTRIGWPNRTRTCAKRCCPAMAGCGRWRWPLREVRLHDNRLEFDRFGNHRRQVFGAWEWATTIPVLRYSAPI